MIDTTNSKLIKDTTVCLTGHRPQFLPWKYDEAKSSCLRFKQDLKIIFENKIKSGFTTYLIGMAEGFDLISAEILLNLREKYNITIVAVVPCLGQELKWKTSQQNKYKKILSQCNDKIILYPKYTPNCMNDRNKYMVDNSNLVIACYNGKPSGTRNTLRYAVKKGCNIIIINPLDYL